MKVCVTADFHGYDPPVIPPCDLLLFAGDLGIRERFGEDERRVIYRDWLGSLTVPVVGIAGNHDFDSDAFFGMPWYYLENDAVTITFLTAGSLKVWGSPLSVSFGPWAHMRPDEDLARTWETIPDDVDIILVHGPPQGYLDLAQRHVHAGSRTLKNRLEFTLADGGFPNLKLVAFGHIHEGYGSYRQVWGDREIVYVNGSYVDAAYMPGQQPIVVDL